MEMTDYTSRVWREGCVWGRGEDFVMKLLRSELEGVPRLLFSPRRTGTVIDHGTLGAPPIQQWSVLGVARV